MPAGSGYQLLVLALQACFWLGLGLQQNTHYTGEMTETQQRPPETDRVNSSSERSVRVMGEKLVVSTVLGEPYMMLKQHGVFLAGNDRFEGYLADILAELSLALGFDYELRIVRDGRYGSAGPNGSWSGMIGEVARGDADIAAGPLTITQERLAVVDFTRSFMMWRPTALLKKPRRRRDRISSAQELMDSNVKYGVVQDSSSHYLFSKSETQLYKNMWSRMMTFWPPAFVHSVQEGAQRARMEEFAFIVDSPIAEYLANRKPCDLYTIEPFLGIGQYGFAIAKGSDLVNQINREMARLEESQELQFMYLRWWRGECTRKRNSATSRPRKHATTTTTTTMQSPWRYATHVYNPINSGASSRLTSFGIGYTRVVLYFCVASFLSLVRSVSLPV